MEEEQVLHASPYVVQIEKYANSLKQLSSTFLELEDKKNKFTSEEIERMFQQVKETVCEQCEKCQWCWGENFVHTYQMGYEILSAVESYGSELNVETKRKLAALCDGTEVSEKNAGSVSECQTEHALAESDDSKQERLRHPDGYFCRYDPDDSEGAGRQYLRRGADGKETDNPASKRKSTGAESDIFSDERRKTQDSDDRSHDGQDLHDGAGNGENCLPDLRTPDGSGLWTETGSGERLCDTDF